MFYKDKSIVKDGFTAKFDQDIDPLSPDEFTDMDSYVVGWHREFSPQLSKHVTYAEDHVKDYLNDAFIDPVPKKHLKEDYGCLMKDYWVFPLNAYIHSGVILELDEQRKGFVDRKWDVSNWLGAVLVSKKTFRIREKALKFASCRVDEWNQYMNGDVWCIEIEKDGVMIESCGGFYGSEYAKEEAERMLDYEVAKHKKQREAKLKTLVSNRVPLEKRAELIKRLN